MDTNPDIYFDNFLIFLQIDNWPQEEKATNEELKAKYWEKQDKNINAAPKDISLD